METVRVDLRRASSGDLPSPESVIRFGATTTGPLPRHGRVPAFIPRSQLYFWTSHWQRGERETVEDIRNGDYEVFENPADAIRWLLADDET